MKKRVILIVLDSVGIGAAPDAASFGDSGAHTLGHIHEKMPGGLRMPTMYALGLSSIENSMLPPYTGQLKGSFGKAKEIANGKDTTCGHWEIAGMIMDKPFKLYPHGFPEDLISEFEKKIGRKTLGNYAESGTVIIQKLGDEHVKTGYPIVYTSADSVFQIAAHEDVIPLKELYQICETARGMLNGENLVDRVIARPFVGANGVYTRTENRRDFAYPPPTDTILDVLSRQGLKTIGIGKIEDIFAHRGIVVSDHTTNNKAGIEATLQFIEEGDGSLIFTNLVDFDMLYGHRDDPIGYGKALEYMDSQMPALLAAMKEGDVLIVTADHGCDPVYPGSDHTREYIPIVVYGLKAGVNLGTRNSFADIGATVFEYLTGGHWHMGESFLHALL